MFKKLWFVYLISILALFVALYTRFGRNDNTNLVYEENNIEFKTEDGYLMWRYINEDDWHNLIELSTLKGSDGKDGADGKDGINGTDGKDGADGKDGINGTDGKDGADGKDGIDGTDGKDGVNGTDGKDGADGKDGVNGQNGLNGLNGLNGINGKDGREVELKVEDNILYWKYNTDTEWIKLFEFSNNNTSNPDEGGGNSGNPDDGGNTGPEINPVLTTLGITEDCFINKTICAPGTELSVNVSPSQTLDFYIVSDENDKVTLLAKENIGNENITTLPWYEANSGNNNFGPTSLLLQLNALTTGWTNVPLIDNYVYENSGTGYKKFTVYGGMPTITDYRDENTILVTASLRARLLTYEEAKDLGCTGGSGSCPDYVYGNLKAESNSLTPFGYWLMTSAASGKAYNVRNTGLVTSNSTMDASGRGIRPVIEIQK